MKKILLLLFFPVLCIAQNANGIVISKAQDVPVENVTIYNNRKIKTQTNDKGEFTINITTDFKDSDTFEFSHIGFTTILLSWSELKKADFRVVLLEKIENLSGLTISNQKLKLKNKIDFNKLAPLKYPIAAFGSVLIDDKVYIIGGDTSFETDAYKKIKKEKPDFTMKEYLDELRAANNLKLYKNTLSIYNIKTDTWENSELKFKKRAYHNLNYYNNIIYVLDGKRSSTNGKFEYLEDQIEVFDTKNQTITIDKTNPHQAANSASFTYKDNIIVLGGSIKMNDENGKKEFTNKVHLYNISSGYWYQLTDMPSAKEASGILIDNKIYLIGGNNGKPVSEIETFNLDTESWNIVGELFSGIEKPAIAYSENIIYIFENRKLFLYNTKSKELKEYIIELPLKASAMYYSNSKLYLFGGRVENDYSKKPSPYTYSISIDEFETTQPNRIKSL